MVVAVTAALGDLKIVGLTGRDKADAAAVTANVGDDTGVVHGGKIGYALLHQVEARTGGGGHYAITGAGCTVKHINCRNLGFGLDKLSAGLRHTPGEVFHYFRLGSDGVTAEKSATGSDRCLRKSLIALH